MGDFKQSEYKVWLSFGKIISYLVKPTCNFFEFELWILGPIKKFWSRPYFDTVYPIFYSTVLQLKNILSVDLLDNSKIWPKIEKFQNLFSCANGHKCDCQLYQKKFQKFLFFGQIFVMERRCTLWRKKFLLHNQLFTKKNRWCTFEMCWCLRSKVSFY